ncbi:hypothetical protein ACF0H5_000645 [Mactra antiquata]
MEETDKCGSDILKDISVLDTIYWVNRVWRKMEKSTIEKCFDKCGFDKIKNLNCDNEIDLNVSVDDEDDDIPLAVLARSSSIYDANFKYVINFDIPTCDPSTINWDLSAPEILRPSEESDDSDTDNEIETEYESVCSIHDINDFIKK